MHSAEPTLLPIGTTARSECTLELPLIALGDPWHDSAYVVLDRCGLRHVEVERHTRAKYEGLNPLIAAWMLDTDAVESAQLFLFEEGRFFAPLLRRLAAGGDVDLDAEILRLVQDQHGSFSPVELLRTPGLQAGLARVFDRIRRGDVTWQVMDHHFCHAANAFLSSSFEEALVFTLDGGGTHFLGGDQVEVHGSVYRFSRANPLSHRALHLVTDWSPGWAWTRVSRILGYGANDAGTVMAMAAYGEASSKLRRAVRARPVWDTLEHDLPLVRRTLLRIALRRLGNAVADDQARFDLAAALQEETERRIRTFMSHHLRGADGIDICLSGGVFLNCVATGKIARWFPQVERIYIPPAPYDGGLAIGLAQIHMFDRGVDPLASKDCRAPFATGQAPHLIAIRAACLSAGIAQPAPTTAKQVAEHLGRGEIIGLFQGASESGRRALGNRSIVADPRDGTKREVLNEVIKKRQWFRPFAPMILHEEVADWFEVDERFESPYMSFAVPFRPGKGELVPAVRHRDGTARVQTVHSDLTPGTYRLLKEWHQHSGVPLLLNTSFNDCEPIVETPQEAISTMLRSRIDGIYFADFDLFAPNLLL